MHPRDVLRLFRGGENFAAPAVARRRGGGACRSTRGRLKMSLWRGRIAHLCPELSILVAPNRGADGSVAAAMAMCATIFSLTACTNGAGYPASFSAHLMRLPKHAFW